MAANADQEILDRREQILDEELDRFLEGINTSNNRLKTDTWMVIGSKVTLKIPPPRIIYTIYRSASVFFRL